MVITIDGLAGCGKSTVASIISTDLKIIYLNSGLLFRSVAFNLIKLNKGDGSEGEVASVASSMKFDFSLDEEFQTNLEVWAVGGENFSTQNSLLRSPHVAEIASKIAVYPTLREILLKVQRDTAKKEDVIVEGRDSGSVVFPDARHKFFLTAMPSVRAKRRVVELFGASYSKDQYENVLSQIQQRDFRDTEREHSACAPTEDAIVIDTSDLGINEVIDKIKESL